MGREHDGDRFCRLSCWLYLSRRGCEDNINIRVDQLVSQLMQQFDALCPTELDENVLAFDVTQFPEPRPHCLHTGRGSSSGAERLFWPIAAARAQSAAKPPRRLAA